jgi:xylan 1,4-beta-xylosidase
VLFVQTIIGGEYTRYPETALPAEGPVWLGVSARVNSGMFRYSLDGKLWNTVRPALDAAVLSDEYFQEGFTGAFTGIFCCDTAAYAAYADFEYLKYVPR